MQRGDTSDRPQWIVRRHTDRGCLSHSSDLLGLHKSAHMTDVGLNDVHGARAENVVEFEAVDEAFARCDRNAALGGHRGKARRIAGRQRLFNEKRMPGGKCVNVGERRRDGRCASVEVDHDVDG